MNPYNTHGTRPPGYACEPDGIPFTLTAAERSKAALCRVHLERNRRERNRNDESRKGGAA